MTVTLLLVLAMVIEVFYLSGSIRASAVTPVSQGQGQFLSGSALGVDLNSLLAVNPAEATNTGGAQSIQNSPLSVSLLNQVTVPISSGPVVNLVGTNGILDLGAVNQYAEADPTGASVGASGAVDSAGTITLGGGAADPANATFHLLPLLGGLTSSLADLTLTAGALTGRAAEAANGTQTGTYQIANLNLSLTSPLVSAVFTNVQSLVATGQTAVNAVPTVLNGLGLGLITVGPLPTLSTLVTGLTNITSADGSTTANLQTGAVNVNVGTLLTGLGLDINNLPPNTDLLAKIETALTAQLVPAITAALTSVVTALTTAIDGISATLLGLPLSLSVLTPVLNAVVGPITTGITSLSSGLVGSLATPLASALSTVLTLVANGQQTTAGTFTESALTVGLLPTAPTPAAQVVLAAGSVGPNAGPAPPTVPTATGINPTSGPDTGGQTVTVTGTGFITAATSVTIGGNTVTAAQVNVSTPTTLSFSTPAHVAGPVGVTVTTSAGTTSPALGYTYLTSAPTPPTATGINPTSGPDTGGQTVTVTGTGFITAATSVTIGGNTVTAAQVNVSTPTTLSFSTPAHVAGPVGVTVTTSAGTTSPALGYTYLTSAPTPPTATGINPTSGPDTGGQTVTVTGTGFITAATSVTIGGNTVPAAQVNVTAATVLSFSTPAHVAGPVGVTVTTSAGTTSPALAYTYLTSAPTPPTATGINPSSGPDSGGQTVTVTGSGFVVGATSLTIGGTTLPPAQVNVTTTTTLTFTTPPHVAAPVGVTVTTSAGTTSPALAYTYIAGAPGTPVPPVITSPVDGSSTTNTTSTIAGTGIAGDTVTVFEGSASICSGPVDGNSNWSCISSVLLIGSHTIVATQDPPNVTSGPSNVVQFTVDPLPPVIVSPVDGSTITDPTPPIGGTGGAGDTLIVTVDGHQVCATTVDVNGDWVCSPSSPLANGHHIALATQTSNGFTSGPSNPDGFTVRGTSTQLASTGISDTYIAMLGLLLLQGGVLLLVALSALRAYRSQA